jgi:hypothetical protein
MLRWNLLYEHKLRISVMDYSAVVMVLNLSSLVLVVIQSVSA